MGVAALLVSGAAAPSPAQAQTVSGEAVYTRRCASCHDQLNPRIPTKESLRKMPATRIVRALDTGAMMSIAFTMHRDERLAVASYLGTSDTVAGPPPSAYCTDRSIRLAASPAVAWNGWSPGTDNARFQSQAGAGLRVEQVRNLKLKWAFGFEGDASAFAQPTVLDGQLFVGSAGGIVHAMRADTGCLKWVFQANGPVRAALLAVPVNGRHALMFGDMTGWFYALDAETGRELWKVQLETHDSTRLTARPPRTKGSSTCRWPRGRKRARPIRVPVLLVQGQRRRSSRQRRVAGVEDIHGGRAQGERQDRARHAAPGSVGHRHLDHAHRGCHAPAPLCHDRRQLLVTRHAN